MAVVRNAGIRSDDGLYAQASKVPHPDRSQYHGSIVDAKSTQRRSLNGRPLSDLDEIEFRHVGIGVDAGAFADLRAKHAIVHGQ